MATGIQTVTTSGSGVALSNAVRTRYIGEYLEAAMVERLYDQLAGPVKGKPMAELSHGSSVQLNFLGDMEPGTTAISEVTDITAQVLRDATSSITPTSRGEALKASELLLLQEYTGYGAEMYQAIGKNMMESVDLLAQYAALKGNLVKRNAARASLDAGTSADRASDSTFDDANNILQTLKVPGFAGPSGPVWAAIMHPYVFSDIRRSGNVLSIGQYQNQNIILNFELGQIGPFRLVVSPWAKVFGAAGADNSSAYASTLGGAASALDTTINVAASLNANVGEWITIGTEETGSTFYPTNERVKVTDVSLATAVQIVGEGPNGGLRFDHASGTAVRNADSVYTIAFGGPYSLGKLYANEVGEYGQIVGPRQDGTLDQWTEIGWKWYGGYGRIGENRILRGEYSVEAEA